MLFLLLSAFHIEHYFNLQHSYQSTQVILYYNHLFYFILFYILFKFIIDELSPKPARLIKSFTTRKELASSSALEFNDSLKEIYYLLFWKHQQLHSIS